MASLFCVILTIESINVKSFSNCNYSHCSCRDSKNAASLCHKNANCWFIKENNGHECRCKDGYHENGYKNGDPRNPICIDNCLREDGSAYCKNQGTCLKVIYF